MHDRSSAQTDVFISATPTEICVIIVLNAKGKYILGANRLGLIITACWCNIYRGAKKSQ